MDGSPDGVGAVDRIPSRIRVVQYSAAALTGLVALVSFIGWIVGDVELAGQTVRYNPMVPVTSLVFLILCASLIARMRLGARRAGLAVTAAAVTVGVIVALELTDFLSGLPVAPDRLFASAEDMMTGRQLGRMSPIVAIMFAMLSAALVLFRSDAPRRRSVAAALSSSVAVAGFVLCIGYAYDEPLLLAIQPLPPALYTSAGMMLLGSALTLTGIDRRPFALFMGDSVRARLMRVVIPVVSATLFAFVAMDVVVHRLGLMAGPVPTSVALIVVIGVVMAVVLRSASRIGRRVDEAEAERQRSEEELRTSRLLLASSLEAQKDTILFSIDPEYRYLFFNTAHADAMRTAYDAEPTLGACVLDLISSDDDRAAAKENYDRALAGESHTNVREYGDVNLAYYESFFNPITGPDGRVIGATGLARDITARKNAENRILGMNAELEHRVQERTEELNSSNEELRSVNEELQSVNEELVVTNDSLVAANEQLVELNAKVEEANRAKNDFLAAMSHELRTPLNSIIGFSGVLLQGLSGRLDDEQHRQIAMINNSGRHLLELINEVLDLAKIESSQGKPTLAEVDAGAIAADMFETLRPLGEAKGIEMRWAASETAPILTDRLRFEQILLNLMSNAVKFTGSGSVCGSVSQDPAGVTVAIADTGCGIAQQDLDRVFDDFYQVTPSAGGKSEGAGLGLAVSRRLAESIDATIGIVSEPGRGSTFTLRLPNKPR